MRPAKRTQQLDRTGSEQTRNAPSLAPRRHRVVANFPQRRCLARERPLKRHAAADPSVRIGVLAEKIHPPMCVSKGRQSSPAVRHSQTNTDGPPPVSSRELTKETERTVLPLSNPVHGMDTSDAEHPLVESAFPALGSVRRLTLGVRAGDRHTLPTRSTSRPTAAPRTWPGQSASEGTHFVGPNS